MNITGLGKADLSVQDLGDDVILLWVWIAWWADPVKYERYYGFNMDAVVIGSS